jgi:hypothetical protein
MARPSRTTTPWSIITELIGLDHSLGAFQHDKFFPLWHGSDFNMQHMRHQTIRILDTPIYSPLSGYQSVNTTDVAMSSTIKSPR